MSRHSPGNTSFPIFHHERPTDNLPYLTLPDEPMHPRSIFTFADSSHKGPCICKGDWYGSSESGSPRIPTRHTQDQHVLSTFYFHTKSFTLTCRYLMMKARNRASQLFLTDHNGKGFHLARVLMVPKLQMKS